MNRSVRPKDRQTHDRGSNRAAGGRSTEQAHYALADLTAAIAPEIMQRVLHEHKWLAPSIAIALRDRGRTSAVWRASIGRSLSALLRWWGWIEPLHLGRIEEQLLLAWLLDSTEVSAVARVWAQHARIRPDGLVPFGDAPNWTGARRGSQAVDRGTSRQCRPVAALPGLAEKRASCAAWGCHAQGPPT